MWNIVRYLKAMWGLFNMCLVVEHLSVGQKASKHKHKCWKTLNYVRHCYPPHILSCTFTDFILSFLSILCYKWTMYYYFFNFHFILCVAFNLPRQPSDCISSRLQCFFPLLTRIKQFDGVNMSVRNKRWSGYWNDHSSYWDGKFVPGPLKQTSRLGGSEEKVAFGSSRNSSKYIPVARTLENERRTYMLRVRRGGSVLALVPEVCTGRLSPRSHDSIRVCQTW